MVKYIAIISISINTLDYCTVSENQPVYHNRGHNNYYNSDLAMHNGHWTDMDVVGSLRTISYTA